MDVGAGTGLFLPLFSKAVGDKGHVHALEISAGFLQHLAKRIKTESIEHNVSLTKATEKSTGLDEKEHAETVDLVFICDVYHHFSYPSLYLHQLHSHMKKGARLVVLDLIRDSSIHTSHDHGWVEAHVRADKPVFRKEIESAGFRHMYEMTFDALHENYVMVFERE